MYNEEMWRSPVGSLHNKYRKKDIVVIVKIVRQKDRDIFRILKKKII